MSVGTGSDINTFFFFSLTVSTAFSTVAFLSNICVVVCNLRVEGVGVYSQHRVEGGGAGHLRVEGVGVYSQHRVEGVEEVCTQCDIPVSQPSVECGARE